MSQAEKLMHELTQNCGIDFNNTRRKLAVEIIEKFIAGEKAADLDPSFSSEALLNGEVAPAIAAPKKSKKKAKESSDASGQ